MASVFCAVAVASPDTVLPLVCKRLAARLQLETEQLREALRDV
jgi:hypothetical protein